VGVLGTGAIGTEAARMFKVCTELRLSDIEYLQSVCIMLSVKYSGFFPAGRSPLSVPAQLPSLGVLTLYMLDGRLPALAFHYRNVKA
jgi:hypothetical protein